MPSSFQQFFLFYRERYLFLFFNVSIGSILFSLLWTLFIIRPRSEAIPLHYDIFFGIDRIGSWLELLGIVGMCALLTIVNALFAHRFFARDKYLSYYLALAAMIVSVVVGLYLISLTIYAL